MKINRLSKETSPYLKQHAENPVNCFLWLEEALYKARLKYKPILLFIMHSVCHRRHAMTHKSFEEKETAKIMNKYSISIKVNREERLDLAKIYQTSQIFLSTVSTL